MLGVIARLHPKQKVHGVGYCLGGTLMAAGAASLARDGDKRFATLSFFAAQIDFTEAGGLTLFTDESQIAILEDAMAERGYLNAGEMAGAFRLLRSNDLIWSRLAHDYLLGLRQPGIDLIAWNADSTRMPYKMHSEYLRKLFLANDLAEGRYTVKGAPVALSDIRVPVFTVATETDHIAPWNSIFKFNLLLDADVTFVLASGGHNAGIINAPAEGRGHYRCATKHETGRYRDPATWLESNTQIAGSWWPEWTEWLAVRSGVKVAPPHSACASDYGAAPGSYVLER